MIALTTRGIEVTVETFYQSEYSKPLMNEYMFAYRITIKNFNSFPIKILSRKWWIYDSNGHLEKVEGEGVIGQQPIIMPDEAFQYVSGCNLKTTIGKMYGIYNVENQFTFDFFEVNIPRFLLICPDKLN